jgi:Domain of unknown function DUF29
MKMTQEKHAMISRPTDLLPGLYEADETAWLEAMAALIEQRKLDELDYSHLREYLTDMARRDRREVQSRLVVLLAHLLKWSHQPERRSGSGRATIVTQQQELADDAGSGVLRNHAETILSKAYAQAVTRAAAEMDVPVESLPVECPYTVEQLLADDLTE